MAFSKLVTALKHGSHDQKRHGRGRGGGSAAGSGDAAKPKSKRLAAKGWTAGDEKTVKKAGFTVMGGFGNEDTRKKGTEKREVTVSKQSEGKFSATGSRPNKRGKTFTDASFTGSLSEATSWGDKYLAKPGVANV